MATGNGLFTLPGMLFSALMVLIMPLEQIAIVQSLPTMSHRAKRKKADVDDDGWRVE